MNNRLKDRTRNKGVVGSILVFSIDVLSIEAFVAATSCFCSRSATLVLAPLVRPVLVSYRRASLSTMSRPMPGFILRLFTLILLTAAGPAAAEDFYRGKTLRLIVPAEVGGGYDSYGRTFAQYFRRHLPGEPLIVVQNMPGGGGLTGANWLFNVAPKDGLVIGLVQRGVPFYPYFGDKNALFVPTRFNWLGSFSAETGVTTVWHTAKAWTMADALP